MSIKSRLPKINQVVNADTTREIYRRDAFHFVWHVNSVRTDEQFQVVFDWSKSDGYKTLTAKLWSFDTNSYHPANNNKTVCYQVIGAIKKMIKDKGGIISFCKNEKDAKKISNFGGEIIRIVNPGDGVIWAVVMLKSTSYECSTLKTTTPSLNDMKVYGVLNSLQSAPSDAIGDGGVRLGDFRERVNMMRGPREKGID